MVKRVPTTQSLSLIGNTITSKELEMGHYQEEIPRKKHQEKNTKKEKTSKRKQESGERMNKEYGLVLALLRQEIISSTVAIGQNGSEIDWREVYRIARDCNLLGFLYSPVQKILQIELARNQENSKELIELMEHWRTKSICQGLEQLSSYQGLKQIYQEATERKIQLITFKGAFLADLYPNYLDRISNDSDLYVTWKDKEPVDSLLQSLGYQKDWENSKEEVLVYYSQERKHMVELHFSLWEDFKGEKINRFNRMNLTRDDTLLKAHVCGIDILTLGYTQHLIYQMFHIAKHVSIEGIGIRYLIDITLFVNRYWEEIDWDMFWNCMRLVGYESFCVTMFQLCLEFLGMNPLVLKEQGSKYPALDCTLKDKLLMDFFTHGGICKEESGTYQVLGIMTPYFVGNKKLAATKKSRMIEILFPSGKDMRDTFAYASKYPVLLPVAWCHRFIDHTIYRLGQERMGRKRSGFGKNLEQQEKVYGIGKKMKVAQQRLSIMQEIGLVREKK